MEILKTLTDVTEKLYREGKIDDRKIFSYATALSLPNGNYGMVGIGFNHDKFIVVGLEVTFKEFILGDVLYEIPLNEIEDVKGISFILYPFVKFRWQGAKFKFRAFLYKIGIVDILKGKNKENAVA